MRLSHPDQPLLLGYRGRGEPTDAAAGKRTLAVSLGVRRTRLLYVGLAAVPFVVSLVTAFVSVWLLVGLLALVLVVPSMRVVSRGGTGLALIPALRDTSFAMLAWAVLTTGALAFG